MSREKYNYFYLLKKYKKVDKKLPKETSIIIRKRWTSNPPY